MTLCVHPANSEDSASLLQNLAKTIKVFVLDVDDSTYHASTGLHAKIKANILAEARDKGSLKRLWDNLRAANKIDADGKVLPGNVGWIFSEIVDVYRQNEPEELRPYLERVFDVDYSVIPPQPAFVDAVNALRSAGRRVVFYSNGPWSDNEHRPLHLNKVFTQIGFRPGTFQEHDIVDLLKVERNPHLLKRYGFSVATMATMFRKSTKAGFSRMSQVLRFAPNAHIAFLDDTVNNLDVVKESDVLGIQIATKEQDLTDEIMARKRDCVIWSKDTDTLGRAFSTAGFLLQEVSQLLSAAGCKDKQRALGSRII